MRTFVLLREHDVTGVSGEGIVAEGVEFSDGTAVLHWIVGEFHTTNVHPKGLASVVGIHGHNGASKVMFQDGDNVYCWPNVPPKGEGDV